MPTIADDMSWKEIKRKVGEMASMENDLRQAPASRDYWKNKFEQMERDLYKRYVELPTDAAERNTVRPGAMVRHAGKTWLVRTLMLTDEGEWLLDCQPEDGEPPAGRTVKPEDCVVVEPRTVEDVLLEFLGAMADAADGDPHEMGDAEDAAIRRYADEIRRMLDD